MPDMTIQTYGSTFVDRGEGFRRFPPDRAKEAMAYWERRGDDSAAEPLEPVDEEITAEPEQPEPDA